MVCYFLCVVVLSGVFMRRTTTSFAFFISSHPAPPAESMFIFGDGDAPYSLNVALFGSMTIEECKMLATLITRGYGHRFSMRVPPDLEHSRFHGDVLILSFEELMKHFEGFFGKPESLPSRSVVSMGAFFDYLRDKVAPKKAQKNPSPSD